MERKEGERGTYPKHMPMALSVPQSHAFSGVIVTFPPVAAAALALALADAPDEVFVEVLLAAELVFDAEEEADEDASPAAVLDLLLLLFAARLPRTPPSTAIKTTAMNAAGAPNLSHGLTRREGFSPDVRRVSELLPGLWSFVQDEQGCCFFPVRQRERHT